MVLGTIVYNSQINQWPSGLVCPWIPSPGRKTSLRSRPGNAGAMVSYIAEWTLWNHVRTPAAFVLLVLNLRFGWGQGAGS